ncbi:response regulator [Consotaella aegiceratis]|uniref:response regulator n=1 Tax=Consotaella aegiceratis TaxID=3097961 RepID=UPI002F3EAB9E
MSEVFHLLLLEDNPADVDLTREMLSLSEIEIEISVAADGVEGMKALYRPPYEANERPDLIVLDLNMPRKDGRNFLKELRQDATLKAIPVIVLSSSEAQRDIDNSYQLGANCYVAKPVDLQAFQGVVRTVESFWFRIARLPSDSL